jgi:lipopolysaccharide transport system permease protein
MQAFWKQSQALTVANLKARYRKTWAGFLWVVLNPLISFGVQAVAFQQFLKIDIQHYLLFLVSGLLPWLFIAQTLEMSATVFVNAGHLIKSISVSPLIFLLAQILDNALNFLAAFALLLLMIFTFEGGNATPIWLLIFPLATLLIGVFALAWLLATANIFFRDTRFLVSFGLQIFFFLTPIFYSREFIPVEWRWLLFLNPFYLLIRPFQVLIHEFALTDFLAAMSASTVAAVVLMGFASFVWRRLNQEIYFHV